MDNLNRIEIAARNKANYLKAKEAFNNKRVRRHYKPASRRPSYRLIWFCIVYDIPVPVCFFKLAFTRSSCRTIGPQFNKTHLGSLFTRRTRYAIRSYSLHWKSALRLTSFQNWHTIGTQNRKGLPNRKP